MPKNAIQHIEWTSRDPRRLQSFYGELFDWNFFPAMPGYTMIEGLGGIFEATDARMPIGITPYVNVADLAASEAQVSRLGGKIHKSRQEVPGRGWFTLFSDPDGNIVGLWQPMARVSAPLGATAAAGRKVAKKSGGNAAKKGAKAAVRSAAAKKAPPRRKPARARR